MAGAFSGHLLNAFNNIPAQPGTPTIVTSGAMSFDSRAHGTPGPSFPCPVFPPPMPHALFGSTPLTEDSTTAKHIATLQAKLNKKLGPEYVSQRPGPNGGPKFTYVEGWKIINLANEVFGFNGWNSSIVSIATDFVDHNGESRRFDVGVTAIVRVTLRDGTYHEDVGYGLLENAKSKAGALDKCKKEAITDALKRTLRNFGNLLGNCLYDKSYAQDVVKIKVPPAKFDKNELYRRPEFEERISDAPATCAQASVLEPSSSNHKEPRIKVEREDRRSESPISSVPRHLRQEMTTPSLAQQAQVQTPAHALTTPPQRATMYSHAHASTSGSDSGTIDASADRGSLRYGGLVTPIQKSTRAPRPRPPPPRAIATSPLARVGSATERSVSFAESMPARASSMDAAVRDVGETVQGNDGDEDEDAFPISTQDDTFFATVDLGDGDLGRPIDFEEGMGSVSTTMVASILEPGLDSTGHSAAAAPPGPQVRDRVGNGTSAGSGGTPKANIQKEAQARLAAVPPLSTSGNANIDAAPGASASGVQPRLQPSAASTSTSSTSGTRMGPSMQDVKHPRPVMTSTDRSPYPPCTKPPAQQLQQHTPEPAVPPRVRTPQTGPTTSALKRSVDVMQAGAASLPRPPIQGMGLAQQQRVIARRPADNNEGNDPKRLKR